ncbi:MAG: hypothetical protein ACREJ9_03575 [Candidatus Rokuibacteriota bacterium]
MSGRRPIVRQDPDRFTYWPTRLDRGGEVLAPGEPNDPVQIIDARDLAEWTIRMVEQGDVGIYNATGPASALTLSQMLDGIRTVTSVPATFTWVPAEFLRGHNVREWSDMPVWVPPRPDKAGFLRVSIGRALAKGLTFRPLAVTARDTLAWHKSRPPERQQNLRAGLTLEREKAVLAAWPARSSR